MTKTIHCLSTDFFIDFPRSIIPDLQRLRIGNSKDNICFFLAVFKLKEPDFAAPAIDFLIKSYSLFPVGWSIVLDHEETED